MSAAGWRWKSALLGAFRSHVADDFGRQVVLLDGQTLEPSPEGLLSRLREILAASSDDLDGIIARLNQSAPILMFDTFEQPGAPDAPPSAGAPTRLTTRAGSGW